MEPALRCVGALLAPSTGIRVFSVKNHRRKLALPKPL
jgi:hypothetical protein